MAFQAAGEEMGFPHVVSDLSGYLSISLWLFAQIPQVVKIYEDKSVEGLSWLFLTCWYLGDLLNFTSCIINEALAFQILLSGYYCIIDTILVAQFYYYSNMYYNPESRWYHRPHSRKLILSPKSSLRENLSMYPDPNVRSLPMVFKSGSFIQKSILSASFISSFSKVQAMPIITGDTPMIDNSLLHRLIVYLSKMHFNLGHCMAWSCTFLYLSSRVPQLVTNYNIKSTEGVSMKLITFALLGNLFYSISLIFNEDSLAGGDVSKRFWDAQLSYFLGACGTVVFDFILISQWWVYKGNGVKTQRLKINEGESEVDDKLTQQVHPINFPSTLAPRHAKKLSNFTPLSPMDFLDQPFYGSTNAVLEKKKIPQVATMMHSSVKSHSSDHEFIFHTEN